jgi:hypothetical protein
MKVVLSNVYVAAANLFGVHTVYLLLPLHLNDKNKPLSVAVPLP